MHENPGQPITFEDIYVTYYSRLKYFATEYVILQEDAENIVHDVFLDLWEQKVFLHAHVNLIAFLFTSVRNRCIDFLRRQTLALHTVDKIQENYCLSLEMKFQSLEVFDEEIFSEPDVETVITQAIDSLPEKCRQIFVMNKIEGKKQRIIAQELNISVNTVESQMAIAYKKLKEALKDYVPLFMFLFY